MYAFSHSLDYRIQNNFCREWVKSVAWYDSCDTSHIPIHIWLLIGRYQAGARAPSQYPKRRLFVRSRKVSKPRDRYFKLSYRFEIWQAHRQHCCRSACQISERSDNSKYKSRGFETLRDLTERRLFGYWDGAQAISIQHAYHFAGSPPLIVNPRVNESNGELSKYITQCAYDVGFRNRMVNFQLN